jgi:hypothetical protein
MAYDLQTPKETTVYIDSACSTLQQFILRFTEISALTQVLCVSKTYCNESCVLLEAYCNKKFAILGVSCLQNCESARRRYRYHLWQEISHHVFHADFN